MAWEEKSVNNIKGRWKWNRDPTRPYLRSRLGCSMRGARGYSGLRQSNFWGMSGPPSMSSISFSSHHPSLIKLRWGLKPSTKNLTQRLWPPPNMGRVNTHKKSLAGLRKKPLLIKGERFHLTISICADEMDETCLKSLSVVQSWLSADVWRQTTKPRLPLVFISLHLFLWSSLCSTLSS